MSEVIEFDIEKMASVSIRKIEEFAKEHTSEVFYAFSIDANLLCLNSISEFEKALVHYEKRWSKFYKTQEDIDDLKYNTGDWTYQGFYELTEEDGFVLDHYADHYDMDDDQQKISKYGLAMDKLLEVLSERDAFRHLNRTDDFLVNRVEHNY